MKDFFISRQMPQIVALMDSHFLSYIDFALAAQLIKPLAHITENSVLFLCHLSATTRQGHLCLIAQDNHLLPSPQEIWLDNQKNMATSFYLELQQKILLGQRELPEPLITILAEDVNDPTAVQTPLCKVGSRIYLQRFWLYENLFWLHCTSFVSHSPTIQLNRAAALLSLEKMSTAKALLPAQAQAIQHAIDHTLTIISGGPGTGKSYTAGQLVRIFWESLPEAQQATCKIALAAPTGKATANLQKSLLKAACDMPALHNIPAVTLHRLLSIRTQALPVPSTTLLTEDLLIVDESSMIDMRLMAVLFAAMKPGARLILLGDRHQLPAVDAGAPFADLITVQSRSQAASVTELNVCLRAELQEIVSFAKAVNAGCSTQAGHFFQARDPLEHIDLADSQPTAKLLNKLCEAIVPYYTFDATLLATPAVLFEQSNRFRALSPLKKGTFGVEQINYLVHKRITKQCTKGSTLIAPIIMLKNDHRLEVFNGEVGLLVRPNFHPSFEDGELTSEDFALMPTKDGNLKSIPALLLPAFEYAYCLSVHKSQGSEFEHVLLVLPPGAEIFGREVLYTAVTRARRKLEVWSAKDTLEATIKRKSYRLSRHAA